MSWLPSSLANHLESFQARWLRGPLHESKVEQVRHAMLAALDGCGADRFLALKARLRHAADAQRMWDLRGELMKTLASEQGEARASDKLRQITVMFRDLLPKGLVSGVAHRAASGPGARNTTESHENFTDRG